MVRGSYENSCSLSKDEGVELRVHLEVDRIVPAYV